MKALGWYALLVLLCVGGGILTLADCTPSQVPPSTSGDAVTLTAGVCKLVGDVAGLPDWVEIACETVAGGVVHVLLPKAEYHAMLARALDAGPGK